MPRSTSGLFSESLGWLKERPSTNIVSVNIRLICFIVMPLAKKNTNALIIVL
jgi:hypothetical protein